GQVKRCPQCNELVRIPHGAVPADAEVKPPSPPVPQRDVPNGKERKVEVTASAVGKREETKQEELKPKAEVKSVENNPEIAAVELVTTAALVKPGHRISRTFPMLRAHRVAGAKFFRDLFMAGRDTTGGRSQVA